MTTMVAGHAFLPPPGNDGRRQRDRPPPPPVRHTLGMRIASVIFAAVVASLGGIFGIIELSARHTRAAIDGELKAIHAQQEAHSQRLDRFESAVLYQFGQVNERFDKLDARMDKSEARMDRMEDRHERGLARLEGKIDRIAEHIGMYSGARRLPATRQPNS